MLQRPDCVQEHRNTTLVISDGATRLQSCAAPPLGARSEKLPRLEAAELRKRIEALYSEDVGAYAESERQYSAAETGRRLEASSEAELKALVP